jgi:fructose-1,6-bisphosphatase/inositol monophosphatase family enzyme
MSWAVGAALERVDRDLAVEMRRLASQARHRFAHRIGVEEVRAWEGGNATHAFDVDLEDALLRFFERARLPVRFSSEERPDVDLVQDPQLLALVDPLDGSDVAARGYPMCSIAVSRRRRPSCRGLPRCSPAPSTRRAMARRP